MTSILSQTKNRFVLIIFTRIKMEFQPTEILENIFRQFAFLHSIKKISKTSLRWRKIIEFKGMLCSYVKLYLPMIFVAIHHFFKTLAKMLLVTSSEKAKMKIEILDLLNLGNGNQEINLNMDELSSSYGTIGIPFQNQFLLCGGLEWKQKKKYRLDDSMSDISKEVMVLGEPIKNFEMNVSRISASYVLLNHNQIWITGGLNRENDYEESKSTEFISYDDNSEKFVAIPGPKLPFKIFYHCMVQVDAHRIYIIGGVQNHQSTAATWIVNPLNFSDIKSGPRMRRWRSRHSCAKMEINGKIFIVVVGDGLSGDVIVNVETVELLDTSSPNQKWTMGKIYIILIDILKLFVFTTIC